MNREIKFRAWNGTKMIDLYAVTPFALDKGLDIDGLFIPFSNEYRLMQYTGLKDKNGKEIYEGDIVKEAKYIGGNFIETLYTNFEVIYHGVSFQYKPLSGSQYTISPIGCEVEVIGNIYEHPNLLNQPTH